MASALLTVPLMTPRVVGTVTVARTLAAAVTAAAVTAVALTAVTTTRPVVALPLSAVPRVKPVSVDRAAQVLRCAVVTAVRKAATAEVARAVQ